MELAGFPVVPYVEGGFPTAAGRRPTSCASLKQHSYSHCWLCPKKTLESLPCRIISVMVLTGLPN